MKAMPTDREFRLEFKSELQRIAKRLKSIGTESEAGVLAQSILHLHERMDVMSRRLDSLDHRTIGSQRIG